MNDNVIYQQRYAKGLDMDGNTRADIGTCIKSTSEHDTSGQRYDKSFSFRLPVAAGISGKIVGTTMYLYIVEYDNNLGVKHFYEHRYLGWLITPA
jgi:hypothetical protein